MPALLIFLLDGIPETHGIPGLPGCWRGALVPDHLADDAKLPKIVYITTSSLSELLLFYLLANTVFFTSLVDAK